MQTPTLSINNALHLSQKLKRQGGTIETISQCNGTFFISAHFRNKDLYQQNISALRRLGLDVEQPQKIKQSKGYSFRVILNTKES